MSALETPAKRALARMIRMLNTGDLALLPDTVSEAYCDHQGLRGVEVRGRAGFARVVEAARQLRNLEIHIEDMFAEGDRAVARIHWRHTLADGTTLERETMDIVREVDGLAVEHWGAQLWTRKVRSSN